MRRILLLSFVFLMTTNSLFSTDLKVGNILSPLASNSLGAALDIIYEIQNINILVADQYTGLVTIKNNSTNTSVFSYLGEYANLAPNSTRTVTVPTKWTPSEIGTFTVSITISFADDIDLSNNTKSIVIDVVSNECITGYEWNEGIGFIIKNNITLFPDEISLNGKMKPGDIIGVSCKVEDLDELIAHCRCEDKINSKIMSDFPDDVEYDWVLTGEGSIVQPTVGAKNSIFYKIPECPKGGSGNENTITVVLSLTIRNKPTGLKQDKPINGAVTLTITYCPERYFPATGEADWDPTAMKITAVIQKLNPGESIDYTEALIGNCESSPLAYDKYTPISIVNPITETIAPNVCPDYAVLLSVNAIDEDQVIIECAPKFESQTCKTKSNKTIIAKDNISYTWILISGKGEFPLGNTGSTVVFRKSQSEDAVIMCEIKNEFSLAEDPVIRLEYKVKKAKKPKAFVGLGDDENTGDLVKLYHLIVHKADDVYGGKGSGFHSVAESMVQAYEKAGYDVTFYEYTSVGIINSILEDPCYQAFCMVAHGSGGNVLLSGNTSESFDEYTSFIARKYNETFWGCSRNPSIRDVQLLACNALDSPWESAFNCNARVHGYKETKLLVTLRFYAYVQFRPYKPLTLALP